MIDLPQKPRFLITRLSAIGDCIHTMPLVPALRSRFPDAFIAWATQSAGAQVIEGLEGLDELIELDRNWMKRPSSLFATIKKLRAFRFDVAIDPQSLTKSSLLGWLSSSRHRIGFTKGQARELSPWLSTIQVEPTLEHVVERYLELLQPLGVPLPDQRRNQAQFNVPVRSRAAETVNSFLHEQDSRPSSTHATAFALLNPGAGWNSKLWPHERYADVARHIQGTHGLRSIVLWAGERERQWADSIVSLAAGAAKLAPDTDLQELTELCRAARLFVGSDTGPLHLAAAVGTPCVAMYGPTKPTVCGPYSVGSPSPHQSIQVRFQDGTSKQRRGDDNSAMREISVEMVDLACDRVLNADSGGQPKVRVA